MLEYSFIRQALIAGILIASICGVISVFVVLRRNAFASHALGHMGITGAAGSALLGINPIIGQLVLNILAGIVIGCLGDKIKKNDTAVGIVLTFILGCGVYFLFLFQNNYAGNIMGVLFGDILAVSIQQIYILLTLSIITLALLSIIIRPLIFASIDPVVAKSKNLSLYLLSIIFLIILAITITMAYQVVGALLVFSLLLIPGAIAVIFIDNIYYAMLASTLIANLAIILSLVSAFYLNLPVSFCLTSLLTIMYFLSKMIATKLLK